MRRVNRLSPSGKQLALPFDGEPKAKASISFADMIAEMLSSQNAIGSGPTTGGLGGLGATNSPTDDGWADLSRSPFTFWRSQPLTPAGPLTYAQVQEGIAHEQQQQRLAAQLAHDIRAAERSAARYAAVRAEQRTLVPEDVRHARERVAEAERRRAQAARGQQHNPWEFNVIADLLCPPNVVYACPPEFNTAVRTTICREREEPPVPSPDNRPLRRHGQR